MEENDINLTKKQKGRPEFPPVFAIRTSEGTMAKRSSGLMQQLTRVRQKDKFGAILGQLDRERQQGEELSDRQLTTVISLCSKHGCIREALGWYQSIQAPSAFHSSAIVNACANNGMCKRNSPVCADGSCGPYS